MMHAQSYDEFSDDLETTVDPEAQRQRDAQNCRAFYAWQDFHEGIKHERERSGVSLHPVEYESRKDKFRDWCAKTHGVGRPDQDWIDRHMQWHEGQGTNPW